MRMCRSPWRTCLLLNFSRGSKRQPHPHGALRNSGTGHRQDGRQQPLVSQLTAIDNSRSRLSMNHCQQLPPSELNRGEPGRSPDPANCGVNAGMGSADGFRSEEHKHHCSLRTGKLPTALLPNPEAVSNKQSCLLPAAGEMKPALLPGKDNNDQPFSHALSSGLS